MEKYLQPHFYKRYRNAVQLPGLLLIFCKGRGIALIPDVVQAFLQGRQCHLPIISMACFLKCFPSAYDGLEFSNPMLSPTLWLPRAGASRNLTMMRHQAAATKGRLTCWQVPEPSCHRIPLANMKLQSTSLQVRHILLTFPNFLSDPCVWWSHLTAHPSFCSETICLL